MHTTSTLPMPRMSPLKPVALLLTVAAGASGLMLATVLAALGQALGMGELVACVLPPAVVLGLACTAQADRRQYVARMAAAYLMLPLLAQLWALGEAYDHSGASALALGIAIVGTLVTHLLGFAAVVWQLATMTTRIAPAAGVRPVSATWLAERLVSLHAGGLPWSLARGAHPGEWFLERTDPADADVCQHLHLCIDEARQEVRLRERLAAAGARPRDADEASMRSVGDPAFDPTRPDAQRSWSTTLQATMVEPEAMAAVRLHLQGPCAEAPPAAGATLDGLVNLLAALVTRSGWVWQPTLRNPVR